EQVRVTYGGTPLSDELVTFVVDPTRWIQDSMNIYYQPVRWSAADGVPVTYLKQLQDRAVPVELQEEMAARIPHAQTAEIDTVRAPAITDPELLAGILDGIADEIAGPAGAR